MSRIALIAGAVTGLVLALGVGGFAPGALYAAAPRVALDARAIPATIGMLQQASNLGQFTVPLVFVPPPVADWNVIRAGSTSLTVTPVAVAFPMFLYVSV